jgi:hypothetical protein
MQMRISKPEFNAFLRRDLLAFSEKSFNQLNPGTQYVHGRHIEVVASALEECFAGKLRRLIVNLPPRSLKSHLTSIIFVAWLLGHRPSAQVICASYAQDLSNKLAADCRNIMTSKWYQDLFPSTRLAAGRQSVHDFTTTENGFRLSTSVGGVLTGRGADFILAET